MMLFDNFSARFKTARRILVPSDPLSQPSERIQHWKSAFSDFPWNLTNLIDRLEYETSILRVLRKSGLNKGRSSWCLPKDPHPLGTRMNTTLIALYKLACVAWRFEAAPLVLAVLPLSQRAQIA